MKNRPILLYGMILLNFFCLACQADSGAETSTSQGPTTTQEVKQGKQQILPEAAGTLGGQQLNIMLARTYDEKALGLMFYESLAENQGMLFVYQTPRIMSFWMKNTMIPLDLVFFSENLQITEWIENMEPGFGMPESTLPRYTAKSPAQYALELKAGSVVRLGLKIGDMLDIPVTLLYSD